MTSDTEISAALDAIERHEARFLAWGIVDRAVDRTTLERLAATGGGDPDEVIRALIARKLVVEVRRSAPPAYRSRMAEGVRLISTLRQQFDSQPWETAARLVADFRLVIRPRRFPARVLPIDAVRSRLGGDDLHTASQRTLTALLGDAAGAPARWLSQFQVEACAEVLQGLSADRDQACIVTAGTGSGKTLAFYLPALLHLATDPSRGRGMRVLAVYPRNELLKDQLSATLREVRRVRAHDGSLPAVRIGAFFGPTPRMGARDLGRNSDWRPSGRDLICPFLVCPGEPGGEECGGPMVWSESDRTAKRDRLVCSSCGAVVGPEEFAVTRRSMQDRPPDILFTTTEMLNRSICDDWSCHVFGIGPKAKARPRLVLLDEVHTYAGPSGAQAAYLLRRWRHLAGGPVQWVGLSATLRDAETFFARLTGVSADFVREVKPNDDDLERRGHEYQLVIRGDPTSQTALLSTSIQTLMVLSRLLDPLRTNPSGGAFGNKVFAFCDNLDLINRLYRQVLDAEGRDPVGKPDPGRVALAALRSEQHHPWAAAVRDWDARDAAGQDWWLVDELRPKGGKLEVGRTSSQDGGVTAAAELVIATASLEVGFDDPAVGAVLQHKAPRDLAQFVQRKGRAGRSQLMRPWTVVVLSDYGRDRLTYQAYEQLFDPELPAKSLPLGNRSVQRMQATFAVLDWLGVQLRDVNADYGSTRRDLAQPAVDLSRRRELESGRPRSLTDDKREAKEAKVLKRQEQASAFLGEVLAGGPRRQSLARYLEAALQLPAEQVDVLLWEGPRSLLLEALPTARRRLDSQWHAIRNRVPSPQGDRQRGMDPLPEFLPANLFSDLCLPEVQVVPPNGYDDAADVAEPVFMALNQFAPGNVSLRYAVWKTGGLWVDPQAVGSQPSGVSMLDVSSSFLVDADVIAQVAPDAETEVEVYRPFSVHPALTPRRVKATSRGRFRWEARFTPSHESIEADLPANGPWTAVVNRLDFYLQAERGSVRLLRFARGGSAEVRVPGADRGRVRYQLTNGNRPVAIGAELDIDAMRLRIIPPADIGGFLLDADASRLRQLRRDRFLWDLQDALQVEPAANPFIVGWIAELTIAAAALANGRATSTGAPDTWAADELATRLLEAFDLVFAGVVDSATNPDDPPLRDAVKESLKSSSIRDAVAVAWADAANGPSTSWYRWLRARFSATVGAAVHSAIQSLLVEFDADLELVVDIEHSDDDHVNIWISDVAVGGGGLVESLYLAYVEDPRRFWSLASAALEPSDREEAAASLRRVAHEFVEESLSAHADAYRNAASDNLALEAWRTLLGELSRRGHAPSHALSTALATRLLRPGSSQASDEALVVALDRWAEVEESLGFAVDQRTACAVVTEDAVVVDALERALPGLVADSARVRGALQGLLWPAPEEVRRSALIAPMPFVDDAPATERTLVLSALGVDGLTVEVDDPDWRIKVDHALVSSGACNLRCPAGNEARLRAAIVDLMVVPTETASLHLYPRVVRHRRHAGWSVLSVELPEAPQ